MAVIIASIEMTCSAALPQKKALVQRGMNSKLSH